MASTTGIKRKALSIDNKLDILKRFDELIGVKSRKEIADELGLPLTTLTTIVKNKANIERNSLSNGSKRQKIRTGQYEKLEKILLEWFHQASSSNLPINGPIVIEKGKEIAQQLNIVGFSGSNGWITRFKKRHGIVYRKPEVKLNDFHDAHNDNLGDMNPTYIEVFPVLDAYPEYSSIDEDVITSENRTIPESVDDNIVPIGGDEVPDDEEPDPESTISLEEAIDSVFKLKQFISSFKNSQVTLTHLNKIETFLSKAAATKARRRTKITDFFTTNNVQ